MVADGAYVCTTLRHLPANITLTGPLPRHAALSQVHPDVDNPPCPRQAAPTSGPRSKDRHAHRPGRHHRTRARHRHLLWPDPHDHSAPSRCLWPGVFRSHPVRVLVIREPRRLGLALLTTDTTAGIQQVVRRYAARWSIEVAFADAKQITGVGEARNRTRPAVERTVPFGLLVQSLVIIWYHLVGHSPKVVTDHRGRARWYTTKTHPATWTCSSNSAAY